MLTQMRIMDTAHSLKLAITQKENIKTIILMNLSCEFICNMQKELKKCHHENYYLFVQGNGIQDRVNVKKKLISTFIENPRTSQ